MCDSECEVLLKLKTALHINSSDFQSKMDEDTMRTSYDHSQCRESRYCRVYVVVLCALIILFIGAVYYACYTIFMPSHQFAIGIEADDASREINLTEPRDYQRLMHIPIALMVSPAEAYAQMIAPDGIMHDEFAAFANMESAQGIDWIIANFMICMTSLRFNLEYISRMERVRFVHSDWTLQSKLPNLTAIAEPTSARCAYAHVSVYSGSDCPAHWSTTSLPDRFDELLTFGIRCVNGDASVKYVNSQSDLYQCFVRDTCACTHIAQICY